MSDEFDADLAPEPSEKMTVRRAANGHGWLIEDEGETVACFSTVADMASWMITYLGRLDEEAGIIPRKSGPVHSEPVQESMPIMFTRAEDPPKPARLWRVFSGGRR